MSFVKNRIFLRRNVCEREIDKKLLTDAEKKDGESMHDDFKRRLIMGNIMVAFLGFVIISGPFYVALLVVAIQIAVFKEVISLFHLRSLERRILWFRTTSWYTSSLNLVGFSWLF